MQTFYCLLSAHINGKVLDADLLKSLTGEE